MFVTNRPVVVVVRANTPGTNCSGLETANVLLVGVCSWMRSGERRYLSILRRRHYSRTASALPSVCLCPDSARPNW